MAYRIFTLILLLRSASATAGLFDAPGRSNFVPADQAFAFDFQQQQHDLNLSWQIKDGYYLYRQQFTFRAAGATIGIPIFVELGEKTQKAIVELGEKTQKAMIAQKPSRGEELAMFSAKATIATAAGLAGAVAFWFITKPVEPGM